MIQYMCIFLKKTHVALLMKYIRAHDKLKTFDEGLSIKKHV
jgi:hypothetical protein